MKRTFLSIGLLIGFWTLDPRIGSAQYEGPPPSSNDFHVVTGLNVVGVDYFDSIAVGPRKVWESLFGNGLFTSMNGALGAGPLGDSLNSALSPYGGRMIGPLALASPLQEEFAALNLRTMAFGLERQTASGSHPSWRTLTHQERAALRHESHLAAITGR